jgi:hypothetical protein
VQTTYDELDEIKASDTSLANETGGAAAKPFKYYCVFKASNNGSLSRENIFRLIGAYLTGKNRLNKVDFENPDYVCIVSVVCKIAFISFVPHYHEYKRYNLIEIGAKFTPKIPPAVLPPSNVKQDEKEDGQGTEAETNEDQADTTNNTEAVAAVEPQISNE